MPQITPSLFAHIQNDFALLGTHDLQGQKFGNTISYLKNYIQTQAHANPQYLQLLEDMAYLTSIEQKRTENLVDLSVTISRDIEDLPEGKHLFIPGGWTGSNVGHAMIYEFSRQENEYIFTVYNSGDGIQYHDKKSSTDKEHYNPQKKWSIPINMLNLEPSSEELQLFIQRLLQLKDPNSKTPGSAAILYQKILPSISYLQGKEIDSSKDMPDFAYTAGQISGTCAQRCLHQMLKINARTLDEYQRFIFEFKMHALREYMQLCQSGQSPLNHAVIHQIKLAIENNLKILNDTNAFNAQDIACYEQELTALHTEIDEISFDQSIKSSSAPAYKSLWLRSPSLLQKNTPAQSQRYHRPTILTQLSPVNFLNSLKQCIIDIDNMNTPQAKYIAIEQLMLSLPLQVRAYQTMYTLSHYEQFYIQIERIQDILHQLRAHWLNKKSSARMNIVALSALSLQTTVRNMIQKEKQHPSFAAFTDHGMACMLNNLHRNPFWATNDPSLDKRLQELRDKYRNATQQTMENLIDYYQALLSTHPELRDTLVRCYNQTYISNNTAVHTQIQSRNLQALHMISCFLNDEVWPPEFTPLITLIQAHIDYECRLRKAINPFFSVQYSDHFRFELNMPQNDFRISTPYLPTFLWHQSLSTNESRCKYELPKTSHAYQALKRDQSESSSYKKRLVPQSTNAIQLNAIDSEAAGRFVSTSDIIARDYQHLRRNPSLQIALTLDYFKNRIDLLADDANKKYVEANLFQPGCLLEESQKPSFLPQFDKFLSQGLRFFTDSGRHNKNSLFFLRLDYLTSQYLFYDGQEQGFSRLENIQADIIKHLEQTTDTDVQYVLQQYLFLTLLTKLKKGKAADTDFHSAFKAYYYLQAHTNPKIFEDTAHHIDMECSFAYFRTRIEQENSIKLREIIQDILSPQFPKITLLGSFPYYTIHSDEKKNQYTFDTLSGQLVQDGLKTAGLPLFIKHHPLLKQLGLEHVNTCVLSADEHYIRLLNPPQNTEIYINTDDKTLTIHQQWTINGESACYELQALSSKHLSARQSNVVKTTLPAVIKKDRTMNVWCKQYSEECIITEENKPIYHYTKDGYFERLDEQGMCTDYKLVSIEQSWANVLTLFESAKFILNHQDRVSNYATLPRHNIRFDRRGNKLIHSETQEEVQNCPSPIHPHVACLILAKDKYQRCIVPIARFYAHQDGKEPSDFFPITHDITGEVPAETLAEEWRQNPPEREELWQYKNSMQHASFRLEEGNPIPETAQDALYLAYIYLATNQTKKAWDTLVYCHTRLGGLTGSTKEIEYISWICHDVPHIFPNKKEQLEDAQRNTPPYIACQMKALSMLCDKLAKEEEKEHDATTQNSRLDSSANSSYARLQERQQKEFITKLPTTIYKTFTNLQKIRRHLDSIYNLSRKERQHLLDYYHRSQGNEHCPRGALGYEWMRIHLEILKEEQQSLFALQRADSLSQTATQRLQHITARLKKLSVVQGKSTKLQLKALDLSLPTRLRLCKVHLTQQTTDTFLKQWINNLPGSPPGSEKIDEAYNKLYSSMTDDELIEHFPTYLHMALDTNYPQLNQFCQRTLIAMRHSSIEDQDTYNKVLLSNILYRVISNRDQIRTLQAPYTFKQLVTQCAIYPIPPLQVYEAVDVYESLLATPEELFEQLKPQHYHPVQPVASQYTALQNHLNKHSVLLAQINKYNQLQSAYDSEQQELVQQLPHYAELAIASDSDTNSDSDQELNQKQATQLELVSQKVTLLETQAGKNQLKLEQAQRQLAEKLLSTPEALQDIASLQHQVAPITTEINTAWQQALTLANEGPSDPKQAKEWRIARKSQARATLSKTDLYTMYAHADLIYSIEKTGLTPEKAQQVHKYIHHALIHEIQQEMLASIHTALNKAKNNHDATELLHVLNLLAQSEIPALDKPAVVLLQHEEKLTLRPRQVKALTAMIERSKGGKAFTECVQKIIPGGGKSKVITPILAEQKANGNNLVIIEVPQSLLATNHVDLNSSSQRLFGKSAHRFEFNRESNSSVKGLESIYDQFIEIMTSRSYMVTTGESIQSLELKYLELLLLPQEEQTQEWEQQVYWSDKIIQLIHEHGDALIDEAHQGLSIKKKLNYTQGKSKSLSPSLIHNAVMLYQYLDSIDPEFVKKAPTLDEHYDWKLLKQQLAQKIISDEDSALFTFCTQAKKKYGPQIEEELCRYLTNTAEEEHELILKANKEIKAAFAFFKEELSTRLPQTLTRRLNEKYGASKRAHLSPLQKTLAIPYIANDIPNETSLFGNTITAVNYSCQMMLLQGISKELLLEQIMLWQKIARQEFFKDKNLSSIDSTPTARGFALQYQLPYALSEIHLDDEAQIEHIYQTLKYDKKFIFDTLEQQTLIQIKQDSEIIHSDSFNHVDLYNTTQAVSGTLSNHTTFHQRLEYDHKSSLGTDSYIVELLQSKETSVTSTDYHQASQFIDHLLSTTQKPHQCRAIIDIRAAFEGVSNLEVAQELARYAQVHQSPFKHILYFNTDQVLCAIDIHKPNAPILLKSTDVKEINRILQSEPGERFTYYDQVRTLGTDITQDDDAHAIVLVDEKTSLQSFLQGSMRMRGLNRKQTIELSTPSALQHMTSETLIMRFRKNDTDELSLDNFFAAQSQMHNLIRRHCLDVIQSIPAENAKEKAKYSQAFKAFLVQMPSDDLFALYGAIKKPQSTKKLLDKTRHQLLAQWKQAYEKAQLPLPSTEETKAMSERLKNIMSHMILHCVAQYEAGKNTLDADAEIQKEVYKELQTQVATINECYDPKVKEKTYKHWLPNNALSLFFELAFLKHLFPLNHLIEPKQEPLLFSPNLNVSENYAYTREGQQQQSALDVFLKPVFLIWYHQHPDGTLKATLITQEDYLELSTRIKNSSADWVATTEDTLLCGRKPTNINIEEYLALREQIRFFNGEFDALLNTEGTCYWLDQNTYHKFAFFEERLLAYHPQNTHKFKELKNLMLQSYTEGFAYISQHAFDDLSNIDWAQTIPETSAFQAKEYKKMAAALQFINEQSANDAALSVRLIQQKFKLHLSGLGYIEEHLQEVTRFYELKRLLDKNGELIKYTLRDLDEKNLFTAEQLLGTTLEVLYHNASNALQPYSELIITMQTHPLIMNAPFAPQVIQDLIKSAKHKTLLMRHLDISNLDTLLLQEIVKKPQCDHDVLDKILQNQLIQDETLAAQLLDKMLTMLAPKSHGLTTESRDPANTIAPSVTQREFENALIKKSIITLLHQINDLPFGFSKEIQGVIARHNVAPEFAITFLKICGSRTKNLHKLFPFLNMLDNATQEDLLILINPDYTGQCDAEILNAMCAKCTSLQSIEMLLTRQDLNDSMRMTKIQYDQLNQEELATLVSQCTDGHQLSIMYPLADEELKTIIITHKSFDNAALKRLMDAHIDLPKSIIAHIFQTETIDLEYKVQLLEQYAQPELYSLLLTPSTHPFDIDHLLVLVRNALNKINQNHDVLTQKEWEQALLNVLDNILITEETMKADVIHCVRSYELSIHMAIPIIRKYAVTQVKQLRIKPCSEEELDALDNAQDIALLLTLELTENAPLLDALCDKCTTEALIDSFLARDPISETHLQQLLKQPALTKAQLTTIINLCTTEQTVLKAFAHPNTDTELKKLIYTHSLFTTNGYNTLKEEGLLSEEQYLSIRCQHPDPLDEDTLRSLFAQCNTAELVSLLLQRKDFNDTLRLDLIQNTDLTTTQFTELVHHCTHKDQLIAAYPKADEALRALICTHESFDDTVLKTLMNQQVDFSQSNLVHIFSNVMLHQNYISQLLEQHAQPELYAMLLNIPKELFSHYLFPTLVTIALNKLLANEDPQWEEALMKLLKSPTLRDTTQYWEVLQCIKRYELPVKIAKQIISIYSPIHTKNLKIKAYTEQDINEIDSAEKISLLLQGNLTEEQYLLLFKNIALTAQHIEQILNNQLSKPVFDAIRVSPLIDHRIKSRLYTMQLNTLLPTMTEQELISIGQELMDLYASDLQSYSVLSCCINVLNQLPQNTARLLIDNNPSFKNAPEIIQTIYNNCAPQIIPRSCIQHLYVHQLFAYIQVTDQYTFFQEAQQQLSSEQFEQCLLEAQQRQQDAMHRAAQTNNDQDKLTAILEQLKVKMFTHAQKASKSHQYNEAAKAAFNLYHTLHQETCKQNMQIPNCITAINQANPVLATHRGYKEILLTILDVLLNIVTCGLKKCSTGNWQFFDKTTDSMKIVNDIQHCITSINHARGPGI